MNYPLLFNSVYCEPVCIEASVFHSVHAVLFPRIVNGRSIDHPSASDVTRPHTNPYNAKRATKAGPKIEWKHDEYVITDDRYYYSISNKPHVAVIPVYGILAKNASWIQESCAGFNDINSIAHAIDQVISNPEITTMVLDIASPGGQVTGIREMGSRIREFATTKGRTAYAFTDERMASAAYWLGSQCNEVYCTPSSCVGSIGTYLAFLDETVRMQMQGLKLEFFGVGKFKGQGIPGKTLSVEDREMLQDKVTRVNHWFTSAVTAARPQVDVGAMEGQTFHGVDAPEQGLVDGIINSWNEFIAML